jgi:hypothetical protein
MNIFVLDKNLKKCARYHCDKHLIKMILESAQILCSVLWSCGIKAPYRKTHVNHPCVLWAAESLANWRWLKELARELNAEYQYRFNKESHKSFDVIMSLPEPPLSDLGLTKQPLVMPKCYHRADAISSYRLYYAKEKTHIAKWTKRKVPKWFIS